MLNPDVTSDASSLVATAVAQGFALFVAVFMAVDVSGGHVNPAVTFAFALGGHISVPVAIFYWISQMVAATLACLLLRVASAGQVSTIPFIYSSCFSSKLYEFMLKEICDLIRRLHQTFYSEYIKLMLITNCWIYFSMYITVIFSHPLK